MNMEALLMSLGAVVLLSAAIRSLATAIRKSGLAEFSINFRFIQNEKPPEQLKR
jgi:hypothetical protein